MDRVLLDKNGLKVSKPGFDVKTSEPNNLLFDSRYRDIELVADISSETIRGTYFFIPLGFTLSSGNLSIIQVAPFTHYTSPYAENRSTIWIHSFAIYGWGYDASVGVYDNEKVLVQASSGFPPTAFRMLIYNIETAELKSPPPV